MLIEKLDRTQWRLAEAIEHIAIQILAAAGTQESSATLAAAAPPVTPAWRRSADPAAVARAQAEDELQISLRDGDLHAQGRLSTIQTRSWTRLDDGWGLHSGHYSTIAPEQWRAGHPNVYNGVLTMADGQFIDIRIPRFVVLAIWPVTEPPRREPQPDPPTGAPYRTPYMDLLDRGIAENGITQHDQGKKELLADWFRSQQVEGEAVSQNLADAMATLIRLPASQRGGAKRGRG
jgi:hypothetical protein